MRKGITATVKPSRATYEVLEEMVRLKVQEYIQDILEEEVREFLGRKKSERLKMVDGRRWISERSREAEEVYSNERDDHCPASSGKGDGGAV